jgi:LysM repeat protein
MKRRFTVLAFIVGLLAAIYLPLSLVGAAAPNCAVTYTVQRGDTLWKIAIRARTTVQRLAQINNIQNPDLILVGQVLCLPLFAVTPHGSFDLVVEYQLDPGATQAGEWRTGSQGAVSRRIKYPLLADSITPYTNTVELQRSSAESAPLLWLAPTDDPDHYILVAIGDPNTILAMQLTITSTRTISDIIPPPAGPGATPQSVDNLLEADTRSIRVQAEVVGMNGTGIPVSITAIDYLPTVQDAASRYTEVAFALHPTADPEVFGYELLTDLESSTPGPPGQPDRQRCDRWETGGGFWSDVWQALVCP